MIGIRFWMLSSGRHSLPGGGLVWLSLDLMDSPSSDPRPNWIDSLIGTSSKRVAGREHVVLPQQYSSGWRPGGSQKLRHSAPFTFNGADNGDWSTEPDRRPENNAQTQPRLCFCLLWLWLGPASPYFGVFSVIGACCRIDHLPDYQHLRVLWADRWMSFYWALFFPTPPPSFYYLDLSTVSGCRFHWFDSTQRAPILSRMPLQGSISDEALFLFLAAGGLNQRRTDRACSFTLLNFV